jgi:hypothetical protein
MKKRKKGKEKEERRGKKKNEKEEKEKKGRKNKKRERKIGEGILENLENCQGYLGRVSRGFVPVFRASAHFLGWRGWRGGPVTGTAACAGFPAGGRPRRWEDARGCWPRCGAGGIRGTRVGERERGKTVARV